MVTSVTAFFQRQAFSQAVMPRIYIHHPPDNWKQSIEALNCKRFFLVSKIGPTVFVIKAEDDVTNATYKVYIGEPNQCSCGGGEARSRLCVHLLFVMIKVLRVQETNPLSWQLSIVDSEVSQILSGARGKDETSAVDGRPKISTFLRKGDGIRQKDSSRTCAGVEEDEEQPSLYAAHGRKDLTDVCSICQEEMNENDFVNENLFFCQTGCGSNFHKRCMSMYSTHAKSENKAVLCPMCRQKWTSPETNVPKNKYLKMPSKFDYHKSMPIVRCYECNIITRSIFYRKVRLTVDLRTHDLCRRCFDCKALSVSDLYTKEVFVKGNASDYPVRWTPAVSRIANQIKLLGDIQNRELDASDYHDLLSLDDVNTLPLYQHLLCALERIDLIGSVGDCAICASPLTNDVCAVRLPCINSHIVHESCALTMLIDAESSNTDGAATCLACQDKKWIFPALKRRPKKRQESKPAASEAVENSEAPLVWKEKAEFSAIGLSTFHKSCCVEISPILVPHCNKSRILTAKKNPISDTFQSRKVSLTNEKNTGMLSIVGTAGKQIIQTKKIAVGAKRSTE